jgi:hypothetical protein
MRAFIRTTTLATVIAASCAAPVARRRSGSLAPLLRGEGRGEGRFHEFITRR